MIQDPKIAPATPTSPRAGGSADLGGLGTSLLRPVTVRIVKSEAEAVSRFWLGLAKQGTLSPTALLAETDVKSIFQAAAEKGLTEEPPILLSDTEIAPPRFVYLLGLPSEEVRARAIWTGELVRGLRSWAPKSLGVYFAPELTRAAGAHDLLPLMLRELIDAAVIDEIDLLVGNYGYNVLLNTALKLKTELEGELVSLHVHH